MAVCKRRGCHEKRVLKGLCPDHAIKADKSFGDPQFAGNGKTKCYVCGLPVVQHSILSFCPFLDPLDIHKPTRKG